MESISCIMIHNLTKIYHVEFKRYEHFHLPVTTDRPTDALTHGSVYKMRWLFK